MLGNIEDRRRGPRYEIHARTSARIEHGDQMVVVSIRDASRRGLGLQFPVGSDAPTPGTPITIHFRLSGRAIVVRAALTWTDGDAAGAVLETQDVTTWQRFNAWVTSLTRR